MKEASLENTIIEMAGQFGFVKMFHKSENKLIRFKRDDTTVDVWYSKMTVGIYKSDNKKDKYLYNVSGEELVEIFANPEYEYKGNWKKVNNYYRR